MHLVLLEDNAEGLDPFSILHTAWELRCGPMRFVDAWHSMLKPHSVEFIGREKHIASFLARFPRFNFQFFNDDLVVALSSSLVPTKQLCASIRSLGHQTTALYVDGILRGIVCSGAEWTASAHTLSVLQTALPATVQRLDLHAKCISHLWQTLDLVADCISDQQPSNHEHVDEEDYRNSGVYIVEPENIFISQGVSIAPLVVLDASKGAIIIENNVTIMAHSMIAGPCFIGSNSLIKAGAKIYPHTVIGEWCKIGGEVENSIIHACSNKQHEGFLGHSYLGEWVNLGADTNTSDLKNTYGNIRVRQNGNDTDTQRMFLGLLCGDHSKSGINTMFNTGTLCGIHANIFGAGYSPTDIPSYTWGVIEELRNYPLKKALSVARTVMARRGQTLLAEEEELMRIEFEKTSHLTTA